jgi:hypothetical protein
MFNFKTRFPDRDDSRFDRNQVAEAHGSMEAGPGLDQRKAGEVGPLQEIAFRQAYGLEDERGLRIEPFEESRVENDAGGVAVAPLDSPFPSRNDHHPPPVPGLNAGPSLLAPTLHADVDETPGAIQTVYTSAPKRVTSAFGQWAKEKLSPVPRAAASRVRSNRTAQGLR